MRRASVIGFWQLITVLLASPAPSQVRYFPLDLGTAASGSSGPNRIDDGIHVLAGGALSHGLPGTEAASRLNAAISRGTSGSAQAVNDKEPLVGAADGADGASHAFLFTAKAGVQDLGTLGGSSSQATAISSGEGEDTGGAQQVAGWSFVSENSAQHAVVWDENQKILDIGTLGGTNSQATAINCDGQVVGSSLIAEDASTDAFVWDRENGMQDLGTLGGSVSQATAINCAGQIVGYSSLPDDMRVDAFLYGCGGMRDLGNLGGSYSQATAINDSGRVVGFSNIQGDTQTHAFIWTSRRGMEDLNSLIPPASGWELQAASSIDNRGRIFGVGMRKGEPHAFVLIPVRR